MDKNKIHKGCIYLYTNIINGKLYVGQSSAVKHRFLTHLQGNQIIDKAIRKYGIENFSFKILLTIERNSYDEYKKDIDELETFYIKKFKNQGLTLYNVIEEGGGNTWASYNNKREYKKHTDEEKLKVSIKLKAYYKQFRKDNHGGKNPRAKQVIEYDLSKGKILNKYSCGKEAADKIGMNYSSFKTRMCKGGLIIDNIMYIYESDFKKNC